MPYCKEQKNIVERDARSDQAGQLIYNLIFYTFTTAWGYHILKDTDYMPWAIGGTGDIANWSKDFPYQKHTPGLKQYFLFTMGHHVGTLVSHFFTSRRNDFFEMGLHHMVTLYLFGGSFLFNFE